MDELDWIFLKRSPCDWLGVAATEMEMGRASHLSDHVFQEVFFVYCETLILVASGYLLPGP